MLGYEEVKIASEYAEWQDEYFDCYDGGISGRQFTGYELAIIITRLIEERDSNVKVE